MKLILFIGVLPLALGVAFNFLVNKEFELLKKGGKKSSEHSYIVKIGDETITQVELNKDFSLVTSRTQLEPANKQESLYILKQSVLRSLVLRKIQLQKIREDGYQVTPIELKQTMEEVKSQFDSPEVFKAYFSQIKDQQHFQLKYSEERLIEKYLDEKLFKDIAVEDAEVVKYYHANVKDFVQPERISARQIVLASETEAKKIYWELQRNRKIRDYFAQTAKRVSITPEAKNGGFLGLFARGEMPMVFNLLFSMKKGEVRGVIKSPYGFHIVKREDYQPKKVLSLYEAKEQIEKKIVENKKQKKYRSWLKSILAAAPVIYHKDFVYLGSVSPL